MQRAIKRAKLPIWYTQGFNPHIYIMFPLTLSLGFESRVEVMDFALLEDLSDEEVKQALDAQMPEGMKIVSCASPVHSHTEITHAEYDIRISADKSPAEMAELFIDFMGRKVIEIQKRTKKGTYKPVDIRPSLELISMETEEKYLRLVMKLPAGGSFNLNANVAAETFLDMYGINAEEICIERTKILLENGEVFC
jgi:radical SAM-linked protein